MKMNLPLFAFGGYSHSVPDQLPSLNQALKTSQFKAPRRSDRLTQLSLLGLAATQGYERLNNNTQLILASGDANLNSTILNNEQIFANNTIPNPIGFINTVNNSTAFHISQTLGITGQAITVSRDYCSLEAGFQIAATLQHNSAIPILLGTADEVPNNPEQHRRRLKLPEEAPLAEGSFWFYCGHPQQSETPLACIHFCGLLQNPQELPELFETHGITHYLFADGCQDNHPALQEIPGRLIVLPSQGHYLTQNAYYLQYWLKEALPGKGLGIFNQTQGSQRVSITLIEKY
jgi:hypothetical protein